MTVSLQNTKYIRSSGRTD